VPDTAEWWVLQREVEAMAIAALAAAGAPLPHHLLAVLLRPPRHHHQRIIRERVLELQRHQGRRLHPRVDLILCRLLPDQRVRLGYRDTLGHSLGDGSAAHPPWGLAGW
jgi:hypothetical protein